MINENENIQDPEMNNSEENVEQGSAATEELTNKLNESNDKYARLVAEFDNYKKRTAKEKIDLMQSAGKDVILKLLPVVDDFDRSLSFMKDVSSDDPMKQGIDLVYHKLKKTMEQLGVKEIEVLGQPFDPEFQEAITLIPAPSPDLKDKVIDVIEKGYTLNDTVIRFAKVVVGQ
ncbi:MULTISPECIES: nucleotide exchange factor GrpE [Sphingobacterium]|uniref:Protein GrpE n=1 Tax=Sphingobacterium cellulitidis TaxID=1768011 RepID=A0A8H9G0Z1_9SPHI|nr:MULTISPECIES: nucleotide exchange factor GrpE [Sphingobacterium]MBA8986558.1 molecular chaperone GrpE [Sphingobacterium soli]OYD42564.1 nucleotide exchange factor GrpE [Sphingobacterium cellulitidis]OYD45175.1 nucleotide exchange factor GrpE [Sphingobacterium cellulitidis]WFB61882.1 nucleotide exchange factor GrpE [Sphingobacterium sp. WM]GGE21167.1 protein GrpE [Sphingobacterium soli]